MPIVSERLRSHTPDANERALTYTRRGPEAHQQKVHKDITTGERRAATKCAEPPGPTSQGRAT
jgi:hypothetical protein